MMVVKEPQEMSDVVKNYPAIQWNLPGMRPLQVGLVLTLVATSLSGILSNPLFTLSSDAITHTPMFKNVLVKTKNVAHLTTSPLIAKRD